MAEDNVGWVIPTKEEHNSEKCYIQVMDIFGGIVGDKITSNECVDNILDIA